MKDTTFPTMSPKDRATQLRAAYRAAGWTSKQISVTSDRFEIHVSIIDVTIPKDEVEEIAGAKNLAYAGNVTVHWSDPEAHWDWELAQPDRESNPLFDPWNDCPRSKDERAYRTAWMDANTTFSEELQKAQKIQAKAGDPGRTYVYGCPDPVPTPSQAIFDATCKLLNQERDAAQKLAAQTYKKAVVLAEDAQLAAEKAQVPGWCGWPRMSDRPKTN